MFTPVRNFEEESIEKNVGMKVEQARQQIESFTQVRKRNDRIEFPTIYKPRLNANKKHYQGVVYLQNSNKEFVEFRVFKDKDLGIPVDIQNIVHESRNDDDRKTTSTQLSRAIDCTIQDFKKGLKLNNPNSTHSQILDCLDSGDEFTYTTGTNATQ